MTSPVERRRSPSNGPIAVDQEFRDGRNLGDHVDEDNVTHSSHGDTD